MSLTALPSPASRDAEGRFPLSCRSDRSGIMAQTPPRRSHDPGAVFHIRRIQRLSPL